MAPVVERFASSTAALRWLVRLRWHAVVGAAVAVAVGRGALDLSLDVAPLVAVIAAIAASNLALARLAAPSPLLSPAGLGAVIVLDAVLLTLLLAWSGGPENPFAVLFLLLITLAAQLAGPAWSGVVLTVAAAGYAALFAWHRPVPELAALHPSALAVALAIGGGAHAFTIARLSHALRSHHAALDEARGRIARAETLAAVGTLAAGAAHELGTPLGTIAIAASDLEQLIHDAPDEAVDDARAIRDEVDRCRRILDRMATRAGLTLGEAPARITAAEVVTALTAELEPAEVARLAIVVERDAPFRCPVHGLVQVLANLIHNAVQASADGAPVRLTAAVAGGGVRFVVDDDGRGVAADVLPRLGEPFVTTRPGVGLGLGLYLGRTFAELCGGRLVIAARPTGGTRVTLTLPLGPELTDG